MDRAALFYRHPRSVSVLCAASSTRHPTSSTHLPGAPRIKS
ncbi:unnamed protein product [Ciceribacter selenitireducens ATCC BAA-1503]|uniref:Uncharacterized protein n=1 Tax=Ciceribacter selenitireducens ATCC BAA-1503 TaxID=1336235 RepID=A0A376ALW0_9HYPH|nr:unnamed protein product [Ciceribacter selenitireducens ATCC BAA-1503]